MFPERPVGEDSVLKIPKNADILSKICTMIFGTKYVGAVISNNKEKEFIQILS